MNEHKNKVIISSLQISILIMFDIPNPELLCHVTWQSKPFKLRMAAETLV